MITYYINIHGAQLPLLTHLLDLINLFELVQEQLAEFESKLSEEPATTDSRFQAVLQIQKNLKISMSNPDLRMRFNNYRQVIISTLINTSLNTKMVAQVMNFEDDTDIKWEVPYHRSENYVNTLGNIL